MKSYLVKNFLPLKFMSFGCVTVTLRSETLLYMSTPQYLIRDDGLEEMRHFLLLSGFSQLNQQVVLHLNGFLAQALDETPSLEQIGHLVYVCGCLFH